MRVVFESRLLYVAEYPACEGVEVVDKRRSMGVFMRDEAARRFRYSLDSLVAGDADDESFEEFIEDYEALLNQPAVYH